VKIDWADYHRVHATRANLLLHLVAVPLFAAAFVLSIIHVFRGDYLAAGLSLAVAILAMALQGRGHKLETEVPRPFSSPLDFIRRWFTEQFLVFPLFFMSGRWWRQYRLCGKMTGHES
jgi:hypothetical protein